MKERKKQVMLAINSEITGIIPIKSSEKPLHSFFCKYKTKELSKEINKQIAAGVVCAAKL